MSSFLPINHLHCTTILAYIAKTPCKLLRGNRLITSDLSALNQRIGHYQDRAYTLRSYPHLAIHIALLNAAGLLTVHNGRLTITDQVRPWLRASADKRTAALKQAFHNPITWQQTLQRFNLAPLAAIDQHLYISQQLDRLAQSPEPTTEYLSSQITDAHTITLHLPDQLPLDKRFDLLQIGTLAAPRVIHLTKNSITNALNRQVEPHSIRTLLNRAHAETAPARLRNRVQAWCDDITAITITPVYLLTSRSETTLHTLKQTKHSKGHILEQLTPHHAIVDPTLAQRITAPHQRHTAPHPTDICEQSADLHAQYLGLSLLCALSDRLDLPINRPNTAAVTLSTQLDPFTISTLDRQAAAICEQLSSQSPSIHNAPAEHPAQTASATSATTHDASLPLSTIQAAIQSKTVLHIRYRKPTESFAHPRTITPLWLETAHGHPYLHAHCHLRNATRCFRLDRISQLSTVHDSDGYCPGPTPSPDPHNRHTVDKSECYPSHVPKEAASAFAASP